MDSHLEAAGNSPRAPTRPGHPGPRGVAAPSRRAAANRQTGYLRVPLAPGAPEQEVRALLADLHPEPDFPETRAGGVGPLVTRLLRNRLGDTATLSNLGILHGEGLRHAGIFPALSGPQAVGVGVVSTAQTTTLTLRTRRAEFTEEQHRELLRLIVEELAARS